MKTRSVSLALRAWLNTSFCAAGLACMPLAMGAQALPDAGRIQQQLEQSLPPPALAPLAPLPAEQPASAQDQPRIVLRQVLVEGAQLIPVEELTHPCLPDPGYLEFVIWKHASLNRRYRQVWSHVRQCWSVAPEIACGHGKATEPVQAACILPLRTATASRRPVPG